MASFMNGYCMSLRINTIIMQVSLLAEYLATRLEKNKTNLQADKIKIEYLSVPTFYYFIQYFSKNLNGLSRTL